MTKKNYFLLAVIFFINAAALFIFRNASLKVDEHDYYAQIISFVHGNYTLDPTITSLPTYPILLAVISKITGINTVLFFRIINMVFALAAIIVFTLICIKINETNHFSIIQFSFFPFIFPYFFLIYTDVLSLLMILAGLYFLLEEKYEWCGFFSILGCLVRQNNIVWLIFFFLLSYIDTYGYKFSIKYIFNYFIKLRSFLIGILLFVAFVIINKGIAMGDRGMHPPFAFHLGNVYFFLFLFFFVFVPLHISNIKKVNGLIAKHKLILPGIILFYIFFILTFSNSHPYNYQWGEYFLRNKVLIFFNSSLIHKTIFFLFVCMSVLSISVTELKSRNYYLFYIMSFLYLIPSWLIEQRYYMIPFAFFLLFKKEEKKWIELSTSFLFLMLSMLFFIIIRGNRYFL